MANFEHLSPRQVMNVQDGQQRKGVSVLENQEDNEPRIAMRSVVFATDFLESSRLALDYAVAFAHHYNARLTIVHAIELTAEAQEVEIAQKIPSSTREHAVTRLESFATGVRRLGISTKIDLREGEPCTAVLSSAAENRADLLVLGTHGVYRGFEHLLIGSNAEKILLSAPYPTLTVGKQVMAGIDLDLNFQSILLVSDMSPESIAAAEYAVSLGQNLGLQVEILQVLPDGLINDPQILQAIRGKILWRNSQSANVLKSRMA